METVSSQLAGAFRKAIHAAFGIDADAHIAATANDQFGDYQSNAAMALAKQMKMNPRAAAEQIKAKLELGEMASEVSIAGPGFINVRLNSEWIGEQATKLSEDERLGVQKVSKPETVVVDYSAPNIAKEMHVGHLRSTIIGDAISRLLEFQGNSIIRQNHIGDWGTQFGMLITYLKGLNLTEQARIEDLDRFYKEARKRFDSEPSFAGEARATVVRLQGGGEEERRFWLRIIDESRRHIRPIYQTLQVMLTDADERGESFYNPMLPGVVKDLSSSNIAEPSEGAIVVFTEGSEAPLIVQKSGGGYGYATTDLAAIRFRVRELGASRIIYVVGAPQSQHLKQVFMAARRAGWAENVVMEHASFGSVLGEDGKMFKARSGESVKLKDLLDEAEERAKKVVDEKNHELPEEQRAKIAHAVGIGAIKYADLSKDRTSDYVFSWDKMLAMDGNTAPYLQYAHARIRSIFRRASERGISYQPGHIVLESPFEIALAKHLLKFGETIDLVARELKPHHLCTYLYELATKFSGFFENCPVIQSEDPVRASRLTLCEVTARTLAQGLELLGIEHPEQM